MLQFVHKHLFATGERKVLSELTPAAIYDIFIDLCKERLHLVISFNSGDSKDISILFRKHKSVLSSCIEINFRVSICLKCTLKQALH